MLACSLKRDPRPRAPAGGAERCPTVSTESIVLVYFRVAILATTRHNRTSSFFVLIGIVYVSSIKILVDLETTLIPYRDRSTATTDPIRGCHVLGRRIWTARPDNLSRECKGRTLHLLG